MYTDTIKTSFMQLVLQIICKMISFLTLLHLSDWSVRFARLLFTDEYFVVTFSCDSFIFQMLPKAKPKIKKLHRCSVEVESLPFLVSGNHEVL